MILGFINLYIPLMQIPDALENTEFEKIVFDKFYTQQVIDNAKAEDEKEIEKLIREAKPGDTLITSTLVNFSQAHNEMLRVIRLLIEKDVRIISLSENFDSENDEGIALIKAMPLLRSYEKNRNHVMMTKKREGIKKAQEEGKYKGRTEYELSDFSRFEAYYKAFMHREINKGEFAEKLGVSRPTLEKLLKKKGAAG